MKMYRTFQACKTNDWIHVYLSLALRSLRFVYGRAAMRHVKSTFALQVDALAALLVHAGAIKKNILGFEPTTFLVAIPTLLPLSHGDIIESKAWLDSFDKEDFYAP